MCRGARKRWKGEGGCTLAEALADVKAAIDSYPPGQRGIDGGGFKVITEKSDVAAERAYIYVQFESRRKGYIDDVEFLNGLRLHFGYRGSPLLISQVFESIDADATGQIGFDELFFFIRGRWREIASPTIPHHLAPSPAETRVTSHVACYLA